MPTVKLVTDIPGPNSQRLMQEVHQHTPKCLSHGTPLGIAKAEGATLTDVDGNVFLDFGGGIGTLNVGHSAPEVVEAVRDQAGLYQHLCFMVTAYEPYVRLAERLNALTPGDFPKKTVLFNSGAEAVENAVKIARAYTGRPGVIVFDRAFHGRTLLAMAMTGQINPYKIGFGPFPPDIYRVPYPYTYRQPDAKLELDQLFRTDCPPERVAAIVLEPVLGEGGFLIPPDWLFPQLREVCDKHGILLVADEVQSGFGRTGKMFATEHWGVVPDLTVMAKSMGGGMPISAVTGRAEILDALTPGSIGGTYGGNPLACRAALAVLDILEGQNLCARAAKIGARVMQRMRSWKHPLIGEVRGLGAMVALELVKDKTTKEPASPETAALLGECLQRGLLVLKSGAHANVIRTLMPLVITDEQLEEGLDILEAALAAVSAAGVAR